MSLTLIEIDGQLFHAQDIYDTEGENVIDTIPILDEDRDLIPSDVCICHAYEPGECCCACTSWGDYRYDDYWEE